MTDTKLRLLGKNSSPVPDDILHIVDDPGGVSPVDQYIEVSDLLQLPFANLYTTGGLGSQTPGTSYVKLTQWDSNGQSFGLTPDATNNKITIPSGYTGLYLVLASLSFGVGATSSFDARFRVYWNSVAQAQCTGKAADSVGHCTVMGVVDVSSAATDLEMYVSTSAASKDVDIEEAALIAIRLAST